MDKEKLQLKHISPYLPYGLKAQCKNLGIFEITDMSTKDDYPVWAYTKGDYEHQDFNYDILTRNSCTGHGFYLSDIKLLLRPLSDLVKPLPSGEIPIGVIGKEFEPNGELTWNDCEGIYEFGWNTRLCDDYQGYEIGWREKDKWFGLYFDEYDANNQNFGFTGDILPFKMSVLDFLFANHFDIFGLIEKGLAIDINKIND